MDVMHRPRSWFDWNALRAGAVLAWTAATVALPPCSLAQDYPNRPIRVLTGGAGGSNDIVARLIAQGLTQAMGQQVIVDNRPSGTIPAEVVARARADGYTLLITGSSFWILPLLRTGLPYDPIADFSPVTLPAGTPNVLAVTPPLPVQTVKELIAYARARPGELNYGTTGLGASAHLGGELFKSMAGIDIVRVNYKSVGAALTDLMAGQVHMTFGTAASVMPHARAGKLRALAVTSAQRSALYPDLPTVAASGLPGYEMGQMWGVFAPAKTPAAVVERLNRESVRILASPESREKLFNVGLETVGSTPAQLAATVKSDMAKWGKLIRDAGIRVE